MGASMFLKDPSLAGKRVLVTAGASGIGLAIARGVLESGARVLVCDVDAKAIDAVRAEFPALLATVADVSDEGSVSALFDVVDAQLGGLDVMVNNAGIAGPTGTVENLRLDDWNKTLAVNVTGQFLCARLAVPRLRKSSNASMINLSSAAGHLGFPGRSAYAASKWAVVGFTKSLAIELGPEGIRVNAILPGAVDGPRIRAVIAAKAGSLGRAVADVAREYESQSAMGCLVTVVDIANMALFASTDCARHITGQELVVDGYTQKLS